MNFLVAGLTSFLVSLITTPATIHWAQRYGFVDDPKTHTHPAIIHNVVTPRAGGIAILLGLLPIVFFLPIDKHLAVILGSAIATVLLGTIDDKYDIPPAIRLVVMFGIATVTVLGGIGITFITNPFGGIIRFDQLIWTVNLFGVHHIVVLADLLAILWIVWVMNAISWSSAVDGQIAGVAAISAVVLALVSLKYLSTDSTQIAVVILAFMTAGSYFGFLYYASYPQRIMPGFGGATLAGYLLAVLAVLSGGRVATAVLVMAVPLLDGAYTIYRRLSQGKNPLRGDREHFHHKLLDLGMSKRSIAWFYWGFTALLGLAAISLDSRGKLFAGLLVAVVALATFMTLGIILHKRYGSN